MTWRVAAVAAAGKTENWSIVVTTLPTRHRAYQETFAPPGVSLILMCVIKREKRNVFICNKMNLLFKLFVNVNSVAVVIHI